MIDIEKIESILKKLSVEDRKSFLHEMNIASFQEVSEGITQSLEQSKRLVIEQPVVNASKFMSWNDLWNGFGIYGSTKSENRNEFSSLSYSKGDLVWVDFGQHNIGNEFSFSHMGVVIRDNGNLLTVIPVTSDKKKEVTESIKKVQVKVDSTKNKQFTKDSLLLLNQITSISKNRISGFSSKSIAKTELMREVESRLYQLHSDFLYKINRQEIERLKISLKEKEEQIAGMQEVIDGFRDSGLRAAPSIEAVVEECLTEE